MRLTKHGHGVPAYDQPGCLGSEMYVIRGLMVVDAFICKSYQTVFSLSCLTLVPSAAVCPPIQTSIEIRELYHYKSLANGALVLGGF